MKKVQRNGFLIPVSMEIPNLSKCTTLLHSVKLCTTTNICTKKVKLLQPTNTQVEHDEEKEEK